MYNHNKQVFEHLFKKTNSKPTVEYLLKHNLVSPANLAEHVTALQHLGVVVNEDSHDVVTKNGRKIEVRCRKPRTHSRGKSYSVKSEVRTKQGSDLMLHIHEPKTGTYYCYDIPAHEIEGMIELTVPFNLNGTEKHNKYTKYLKVKEKYN
jgi:hypothetical protein